jgi:pimeloyl-ACP methyl ester carboxylesterase
VFGTERFISVPGGRRLRALVSGDGPDLVVLEAGLGVSALYWRAVHELLAPDVRVISYDRAGYGASDRGDTPRTLANLATDLDQIIESVSSERVVLVGHSWGGPIVRTAAALRGTRGHPVSGLVLVDPSDENSTLYFGAAVRAQFAASAALLVPLARIGALGRLTSGMTVGLSEPYRSEVGAASSTTSAARASAAEQRVMLAELRAVRDVPPALGDLPIRVLSGQESFGRADARMRASLSDAHRESVARHSGARFVPAESSGHMIPVTEPELIASEALALFGRA